MADGDSAVFIMTLTQMKEAGSIKLNALGRKVIFGVKTHYSHILYHFC